MIQCLIRVPPSPQQYTDLHHPQEVQEESIGLQYSTSQLIRPHLRFVPQDISNDVIIKQLLSHVTTMLRSHHFRVEAMRMHSGVSLAYLPEVIHDVDKPGVLVVGRFQFQDSRSYENNNE